MIGLWLSHELCPYPPALFDSIELLKTANKADRASGLKEQFIPDRLLISTVMVVFDGGMLVQKIRWRLANFFLTLVQVIFNMWPRYHQEKQKF